MTPSDYRGPARPKGRAARSPYDSTAPTRKVQRPAIWAKGPDGLPELIPGSNAEAVASEARRLSATENDSWLRLGAIADAVSEGRVYGAQNIERFASEHEGVTKHIVDSVVGSNTALCVIAGSEQEARDWESRGAKLILFLATALLAERFGQIMAARSSEGGSVVQPGQNLDTQRGQDVNSKVPSMALPKAHSENRRQ